MTANDQETGKLAREIAERIVEGWWDVPAIETREEAVAALEQEVFPVITEAHAEVNKTRRMYNEHTKALEDEIDRARAEATRYVSERDDALDDRSRFHARWLAASRALDEARGLLADASGAMADLLRASMNRTEFHGGTRHEYWIGWQDGDSVDPTELKNQARACLEAMIAFDAAHPAPEVAPDAAQAVRPARTCK